MVWRDSQVTKRQTKTTENRSWVSMEGRSTRDMGSTKHAAEDLASRWCRSSQNGSVRVPVGPRRSCDVNEVVHACGESMARYDHLRLKLRA